MSFALLASNLVAAGTPASTTTTVAQNCTVAPGGTKVVGLCTSANSLHISVAYRSIAPILILAIGALVLLAVSAVLPKRPRVGLYPALTSAIGGLALLAAVLQWFDGAAKAGTVEIGGQIFYDRFSVLLLILISIAVILSSLASDGYLRREGLDGVEAYVLMLMSATGAMLMAEAGGLIMLFLGLEIMSISLYVMAAFHRRRTQSGEAGLKYFILGSFSSALFLYGVALVYGATGSTQFTQIASYLAGNVPANTGVLLAGMALLIVGLGFKVAAVPFHFWTPDVYQGSPTPFTGFMAAVAKAAGFAGLLRVLTQALGTQQADWKPIVWLLAVLTLGVGAVMAIAQRDLKRMLAYSSISQAGYVLLGVQAATTQGSSAALFYLFTYTFIVIGTFAVVDVVQGKGEARTDLGAIRGLARRNPLLGAAMLVLLLAQAGVPFTSGFLAKFYVIQASVDQGQYYLAVIAMLAAAVAAFFYLRVGLLIYQAPNETEAAVSPSGGGDGVFLAGLEPVPSLDGNVATAVLQAPPSGRIRVPGATALVIGVSVLFTIAAGVSSFAIDFAKAAHSLL
ncbi:MAG: NADH-quinone oxidoreductase subunit N [Acidimicrobiales bacterium]